MATARTAMAHFADPAQLAEAFERLHGGASVIYATGPASLASAGGGVRNPTVDLVQRWVADGRATLAQGRDPVRRDQFNYRVYRKSVPDGANVAAPAAAPAPPGLAALHLDARRVYRLLAQIAADGRACPTNEGIADLLDLLGHEQARHRFNQLVQAGLVRVIEPNRFGTRVIEVTATGHRSAAPQT